MLTYFHYHLFSIISVIIIVIMDMIIVIEALLIKTNMMLAIIKPFDEVSLLQLTYWYYHLFAIISVIFIEVMDMIIMIKVSIIKIIMMIHTNMMLAIKKPFDKVSLLLLTSSLYHLVLTISVTSIVIMDMIIVIKLSSK